MASRTSLCSASESPLERHCPSSVTHRGVRVWLPSMLVNTLAMQEVHAVNRHAARRVVPARRVNTEVGRARPKAYEAEARTQAHAKSRKRSADAAEVHAVGFAGNPEGP